MTGIPGVIHTALERHADDRGYFTEIARAAGLPVAMAQSNHSHSASGVVRGLHFHRKQSDLWYVVGGRINAVLVDLRDRTSSPATAVVPMSADSPATLYIPPGVAHGFAALEESDLVYWVSHEFDDSDEFGVAWDDPALALDWGVTDPVLSERDRSNPPLDWDRIPSFS